MWHNRKRSLSLLLTVVMCLSLLPMRVRAEEDESSSGDNYVEPAVTVQAEQPTTTVTEAAAPAAPTVTVETPAEPETPAQPETPAEPETPSQTETPVETQAPAQSETPVETQAPTQSEAPVETQTPTQSEAPAEMQTPTGPVSPTETETTTTKPEASTKPESAATSTPTVEAVRNTVNSAQSSSLLTTSAFQAYDGEILTSGLYLVQQTSYTCTLASAAMMLRSRMYLSDNSLWSSITESALRPVAWLEGSGLYGHWSYTIGGNTMTVSYASVSGMSADTLKSLLDAHPEGIEIYVTSVPHAVLVTDYEDGVFYCADPANVAYSGRRPLSASWLATQISGNTDVLSEIRGYWYIASYSIEPDYTITLDANGGECSVDHVTAMSGEALDSLPTPTREGYTFAGWTVTLGGDVVENGAEVDSDMTLYARWIRNSNDGNKVTFDANGGQLPTAAATYTATGVNTLRTDGALIVYDESDVTVDTDETGREVILNSAGRIVGIREVGEEEPVSVPVDGLVISGQDGWDETLEYSGILATEQMTLGQFVGINYETMELSLYDTYGAYLTGEKYVTTGSFYGNLPTPTKAGYKFSGWYTSASGGELVTSTTIMTEEGNVTLYAQWAADTRIIDLESNDGTGQFTRMSFSYGLAYGSLPVLTRAGYAFEGWWTEETGGQQVTAQSIVSDTGTLYAHWREVSGYAVTYDANGGIDAPDEQEKAVDADLVLSSAVPTRTGYTFLGWGVAPTDTVPSYYPGQTYTESANLTLYALWSASTYQVVFMSNGGHCDTYSKTVVYGGVYGSLPTPTRSGYTFTGWYTMPNGGKQIVASSTVDSMVVQYLYASWEEGEPEPDPEPFHKSEKDLSAWGMIPGPLVSVEAEK